MEFGRLYFNAKRFKKNILISKIYKLISRCLFTCDIPLEADIDDTVYFCHSAFGTVINPNAKIGGGVYHTTLCNDWGIISKKSFGSDDRK